LSCCTICGCLSPFFRLGIRITRGQIKLFADFLQSDIIIASPVALATKLAEDAAAAAERAAAGSSRGPGGRGRGRGGLHAAAAAAAAAGGGGGAGASGVGGEADFLSSIEVCVVERADVMLMQNWQHVVTGEWAGYTLCTVTGLMQSDLRHKE
jgi:U3 small nucleolar RNA-associated protein 25